MTRLRGLAVILSAMLFYHLTASFAGSEAVPPLNLLWHRLVQDREVLLSGMIATAIRATVGLLLAVVVGSGVGYAMALIPTVRTVLSPLVSFLRPLPSTALIVLFAMWFKISRTPWLVTAYGALWPIILNTLDKYSDIDIELHQTVRAMEVHPWRAFLNVYSRALLPGLLSGIRVAVSISVILCITAELVLAPDSLFGLGAVWKPLADPRGIGWSLGAYLGYFYHQGDVPAVVVAVVASGLVGAMLNELYTVVHRRILRANNMDETLSTTNP